MAIPATINGGSASTGAFIAICDRTAPIVANTNPAYALILKRSGIFGMLKARAPRIFPPPIIDIKYNG